jgi:hypothetical protein
MKLFLDDLRAPPGPEYVVARSTDEALTLAQERWPSFMSLDHDLGGEDTTMVFLRRLVNEVWDGSLPVPEYTVHSANPVGRLNIIAFLESWKRSVPMKETEHDDGRDAGAG